jgi:hypothetical protein
MYLFLNTSELEILLKHFRGKNEFHMTLKALAYLCSILINLWSSFPLIIARRTLRGRKEILDCGEAR